MLTSLRNLSLSCFLFTALAGAQAFAQTQMEMNAEAGANYQKTDKALNATYQKLLAERKNDPFFVEKLKRAQLAWIAYRDAMLDLQYPERKNENIKLTYGSAYPMCYSTIQAKITKSQQMMLSEWLESSANKHEGDVCTGSKVQ